MKAAPLDDAGKGTLHRSQSTAANKNDGPGNLAKESAGTAVTSTNPLSRGQVPMLNNTTIIADATHISSPQGFRKNYDRKAFRDHGRKEWSGPKAYTADSSMGAWTTWTPEKGVIFTIDTTTLADYTLDQVREFHAALGDLITGIEA